MSQKPPPFTHPGAPPKFEHHQNDLIIVILSEILAELRSMNNPIRESKS